MKVSQQLTLLVGGLAVALVGIGIFGLQGKRTTLESLHTVYEDRAVPLRQLSAIADEYASNIIDTSHKVSNGNIGWAEARNKVAEARETIRLTLEAYLGTAMDEAEEHILAELRPQLREADAAVDRLQAILRREDGAALEAFNADELYQRIDPAYEVFGRLMQVQLDMIEAEHLNGTQEYAQMRLAFIATLAVILLLGILLACISSPASVAAWAPSRGVSPRSPIGSPTTT
ncbi:MCP four helix bundle domain-containing protein [Halomonas sp. H5]|uniref:MCP four helix bundle domain-containing protein n=1 Tax=Halomonas sp. H5 TaxID=3423910 RepID=UPI003D368857